MTTAFDLIGRALTGRPRYYGAALLSTNLRWSREEQIALAALARANIPLTAVSAALGRSETSIVSRCKHLRLPIPPSWT